jgi:hypothetical protein
MHYVRPKLRLLNPGTQNEPSAAMNPQQVLLSQECFKAGAVSEAAC